MKKLYSLILLSFIVLLIRPEYLIAQQGNEKQQQRPTVGLVLSGGGAKGFAYIGLLKAIQKAGLRLDYIGGTSIGSIIGGLYALGYDPDSIAKIVKGQNWDHVLRDVVDRKYIAFEEKGYSENSIATFPFDQHKIELRSSLYEGQNIDLLLNRYFTVDYKTTDFSKLPTPFICMATNILNGKAVTLKSGYLPQAIRASMSIPVYFSPTYYQGKYLIDGGVIDNYPAQQVKKMGAGLIVGLDVQHGLTDKISKLNTVPKVFQQIISYYRVAANKEGYKITNLYIPIDMKYEVMDFDKYDSIMAVGDRAAQKYYEKIKALADSLNKIKYEPVRIHNTVPLDSIRISEIHYQGYKEIPLKFLKEYFNKYRNSKISILDLEHTIDQVYGTKFFSHVSYELQPRGQCTDLLIKVHEASPGSLGAAVHFDSDYQGSILLNMVLRNKLGKGSKLFAQTILGSNPRFKTMYLFNMGSKIGLGTSLDFYSLNFNLYQNDTKKLDYQFFNFSGAAFINATIKNLFNFRSGFEFERFRVKKADLTDSAVSGTDEISSYGNLFFEFNADTYDRAYFPTMGFRAELNFRYRLNIATEDKESAFSSAPFIYLNYDQNIKLANKWVFSTGFFTGMTLGLITPPPQNQFYLGGQNPDNYFHSFVPFTGLRFVQEIGNNLIVVRGRLRYNLIKKFYLTGAVDAGEIGNSFNPSQTSGLIVGYGLTLSYDSFIGPVQLSLMNSNQPAKAMVYFNLGYWF
ncbi:MAG: patatin-like phospholipase family protein [Bacteroidales bacterium]|nr:patatin-like phospholipase family protein [Bacteroidales bacterium]